MKGTTISSDGRRALAAFIAGARREIVDSVVRSERPAATDTHLTVLAHAALDDLCADAGAHEFELRAHAIAPGDARVYARVVASVCNDIAKSEVVLGDDGDAIAAYLAARAHPLANRERGLSRPATTFDPTELTDRTDVVASLLSAMEARDSATCDHSRAVGMWCGRIAKGVGLDAQAQSFATLAGTLHDVGKVATPTEILLKPGPLDDDEWETMRAHPRIGAKMLERIPSLREFAPIVRAHHERIDGRGYPDRIRGNAIPFVARIVAVADSFHAMISKRPYRPALPIARALDELSRGAGTQYDPRIVDAVLGIVQPAGLQRSVLGAGSGR